MVWYVKKANENKKKVVVVGS